jgi:hypothetical protein
MNNWKLPWDGGCLRGQVRFRVIAPPLLTMRRLSEVERECMPADDCGAK